MHYGNSRRRRGRKKEREYIQSNNSENFSNLGRKMYIQIHKAQRTLNRLNLNKATLRNMIIKFSKVKDKDRILTVAREKQFVTYKRTFITLSVDLLVETLQARRQWDDIFKC